MQSISDPSAMTGLPSPQLATQAVGMPATPRSNLEAFFLENAGQVFRGFNFLKSEFAEAEDHVVHHLGLLFHAVNLAHQV